MKSMFIPPPLLLFGAIAVSFLASTISPGLGFTVDFLPVVGIALVGTGAALFVWTVQFFRKHKTTLHPRGKPSAFITTGPYSVSRNPIYLGFFFISLGTALLFANILALVGPVIFFLFINTSVIPFEENMLTGIFGLSYHSYRKRIRRWL